LRRHVYPTFGDRSLASVRPSEVQAWVRGLEEHLAPSTIEVVYSFLAGVFRAVRDRLIVATPCVDVRLPTREPKRVEPLATEQVEALILKDMAPSCGSGGTRSGPVRPWTRCAGGAGL
jgi:hypothetical protein